MKAMDTQTPPFAYLGTTPAERRAGNDGHQRAHRKVVCAGTTLQNYGLATPPSVVATCRPMSHGSSVPSLLRFLAIAVLLLVQGSLAAFISDFSDCLSPITINSDPKQLQFTPLWVWASFNSSSASHNLNVTIYGNVSGKATVQQLPPPGDPQWTNPNDTLGKIVDEICKVL